MTDIKNAIKEVKRFTHRTPACYKEISDRFVFGFDDELEKLGDCIPPVCVMKDTGKAMSYIPPLLPSEIMEEIISTPFIEI